MDTTALVDMLRGMGRGAKSTAKGIGHAIQHPIQTAQGVQGFAEQMLTDPINTGKGVIDSVAQPLIKGDYGAMGEGLGGGALLGGLGQLRKLPVKKAAGKLLEDPTAQFSDAEATNRLIMEYLRKNNMPTRYTPNTKVTLDQLASSGAN